MSTIAKYRKKQVGILAAAIMATVAMPTAFAMPDKPDVVQNVEVPKDANGKVQATDGKLDIKVTGAKGIVNWDKFDIGSGETVTFRGNGTNWMVLNRVPADKNAPSMIDGNLYGRVGDTDVRGGTIFLVNPSGITFGNGASVDVGSFVASTIDINDEFFIGDRFIFNEDGGTKDSVIKNLGSITASDKGIVALLAHQVVSGGTLTTDDNGMYVSAERLVPDEAAGIKASKIEAGQVVMAAGKSITLELEYDDKIGVRLNEDSVNKGVIINEESQAFDYVINASDVTSNRGYVLMKASDAKDAMGTHLICQTGKIQASSMEINKAGDIILQAANINAGGTLNANDDNAKIEILGQSLVSAEAYAMGDNGKIIIDSNDTTTVELAGARLHAAGEVTTRSDHSVVVLDGGRVNGNEYHKTTVEVGKNGTAGVWNIIGSKVNITDKMDKDEAGNYVKLNLDMPVFNLQQFGEVQKRVVNRVSNTVIGETLATSNVNIETKQFPGHYLYSEANAGKLYDEQLTTTIPDGVNDIEVNAAITKAGTKDTTLTMTAFQNEDPENCLKANGTPADNGNIILRANITTGAYETDEYGDYIYNRGALNVKLTANNISVDSGEYAEEWDKNKWDPISIHTWGEENTPGSVTINGNVNSYEKAADKTHAALVIESGKVEIDGSVGEDASLYDLSVYSEGSIEVTGNVKADHDVILWTRGKDEKRAEAQSSSYFYKLPARDPVIGRDITVGGTITADNTVKLVAGNDVTIKGKVTGNAKNIEETADENGSDEHAVVLIVAQGDFYNHAGKNAIEVPDGNHWKVYSTSPETDWFDDLDSGNLAQWGWGETDIWSFNPYRGWKDPNNRYIFKVQPYLEFKAEDNYMKVGDPLPELTYTGRSYLDSVNKPGSYVYLDEKKYTSAFKDGDTDFLKKEYGLEKLVAALDTFVDTSKTGGYKNGVILTDSDYKPDVYRAKYLADCYEELLGDVRMFPEDFPDPDAYIDSELAIREAELDYELEHYSEDYLPWRHGEYRRAVQKHGYKDVKFLPADFTVFDETPKTEPKDEPKVEKPEVEKPKTEPKSEPETEKPDVDKPDMDNLTTKNLDGTASYTIAESNGASADRVLGLETAELPVFNEKNGTVKLYGTYDVSFAPDMVKMEPTAKVLPEPDQEKNQYRELESELTTSHGTANFKLTYNGSTLDIYPTDNASKKMLEDGHGKKNEEVESKALFAAFTKMGITLDDLDGVYTHFASL